MLHRVPLLLAGLVCLFAGKAAAGKRLRSGSVSLTHSLVEAFRSPPKGPSEQDFLHNLTAWREALIDGITRTYKNIRQEADEKPYRLVGPHTIVHDIPQCNHVFPKGVQPFHTLYRHSPDRHHNRGQQERNKIYLVRDRIKAADGGKAETFAFKAFAKHSEFMAEYHALSVLKHDNIVKPVCWVASNDIDGRPGLVMEYVKGQKAGEWARHVKGHPSIRKVVARLVSVVSYIHYMGFLHSDIKPDNLIVTPEGKLVVIDWGFAERIEEARPHRGTLSYYPPEKGGTVVVDDDGDMIMDDRVGSWQAAIGEGSEWWSVALTTLVMYGNWMLQATGSPDRYRPIVRRREDGVYEFQPPIKSIPRAVRSFCHLLLQPNPRDRQFNTPRLLRYLQSHDLFSGLDWSEFHMPVFASLVDATGAVKAEHPVEETTAVARRVKVKVNQSAH